MIVTRNRKAGSFATVKSNSGPAKMFSRMADSSKAGRPERFSMMAEISARRIVWDRPETSSVSTMTKGRGLGAGREGGAGRGLESGLGALRPMPNIVATPKEGKGTEGSLGPFLAIGKFC